MVLHAVEPGRLHAAWWISEQTASALRRRGRSEPSHVVLRIRPDPVSDPGPGSVRGAPEISVGMPEEVAAAGLGSRYVNVTEGVRSAVAELCVACADGRRLVLARSNRIVCLRAPVKRETPRSDRKRDRGPPDEFVVPVVSPPAESWLPRATAMEEGSVVPADAALASFPEAGGRAAARPVAEEGEAADDPGSVEAPADRLETEAPPGADPVEPFRPAESVEPAEVVSFESPASALLPSSFLPLPSSPSEPAARLEIAADLVVYGSAKPGTEIVVSGVVIPVERDGTFRLRLSLPIAPAAASEAIGRAPEPLDRPPERRP